MTKIPVGATIAHAYRFVFGNVLTVLEAIWLPLLAQMAVGMFILRRMTLFLAASLAHDPAIVSQLGSLVLLFCLSALFVFAEFAAATRVALGQGPRTWHDFPFGKPMWRLLGGCLFAIVALIACALIGALAAWLVGKGLGILVRAIPWARIPVIILLGLIAAAYLCALFLIAVRFLFLLAPANIAEHRLGVGRAWELSAGNFWRILLILLAVMVPVGFINYGYDIALAGWPPHMANLDPQARNTAQTLWQLHQITAMLQRWYFTLPFMAVMMLFQCGAGCAAQVFAYRALVPEGTTLPPDAPTSAD